MWLIEWNELNHLKASAACVRLEPLQVIINRARWWGSSSIIPQENHPSTMFTFTPSNKWRVVIKGMELYANGSEKAHGSLNSAAGSSQQRAQIAHSMHTCTHKQRVAIQDEFLSVEPEFVLKKMNTSVNACLETRMCQVCSCRVLQHLDGVLVCQNWNILILIHLLRPGSGPSS